MKRYLPTLGRLLMALIFLMSGFGKLMNPAHTQQFMAANGLPLTGLLLIGALLFELGGGLSLLLGYRARWSAAALVLFLIPATLVFHTNFAQQAQMVHFLKNLAIIGGLLMVVTHGAGSLSLDARRQEAPGKPALSGATPAGTNGQGQQEPASRKPVEA